MKVRAGRRLDDEAVWFKQLVDRHGFHKKELVEPDAQAV
jgi:hypothetical protein